MMSSVTVFALITLIMCETPAPISFANVECINNYFVIIKSFPSAKELMKGVEIKSSLLFGPCGDHALMPAQCALYPKPVQNGVLV